MTVNTKTLPPTWQRLPLGDLVSISGRHVNPGDEPSAQFNYISLDNIEAGTGRIVDFEPTAGREIGSAKTSFRKGDLLYCRLRPYLQKVVIAPFDGITNPDLLLLRTHETIDVEYLRDFLLGPKHLADVTRLMSGARMPRVRSDELFPGSKCQYRFCTISDESLYALAVIGYRIARIRGQLDQGLSLTQQYEAALLTAAYCGELSECFRNPEERHQGGKSYWRRYARSAAWMGESDTIGYALPGARRKTIAGRRGTPNPPILTKRRSFPLPGG